MSASLLSELVDCLRHDADDFIDDWLDLTRDELILAARDGCFCIDSRKPCEVHDAYDDGVCDLIDRIQGQRGST